MPKRGRRSMIDKQLVELVARHGPEAIYCAARNHLDGTKPDLRGYGINGATRDTARAALELAQARMERDRPFRLSGVNRSA